MGEKSLVIQVQMNSDVEDVLAFKTCCGLKMMDQNLEIRLTNHTDRDLKIDGGFQLETEAGNERLDGITPVGTTVIRPGYTAAFYCYMDERRWKQVRALEVRSLCEEHARIRFN